MQIKEKTSIHPGKISLGVGRYDVAALTLLLFGLSFALWPISLQTKQFCTCPRCHTRRTALRNFTLQGTAPFFFSATIRTPVWIFTPSNDIVSLRTFPTTSPKSERGRLWMLCHGGSSFSEVDLHRSSTPSSYSDLRFQSPVRAEELAGEWPWGGFWKPSGLSIA